MLSRRSKETLITVDTLLRGLVSTVFSQMEVAINMRQERRIMKGIRRKVTAAAVLLILGTILASGGSYAGESAKTAKFVILHTNDVHGSVVASDRCLGMEAVSQLRKDYEKQGYDVLLMDAGDMLQGDSFASFSQGKSLVTIMNVAGYDVLGLGNHDFDYGADVLEQRISEMDFPALAANITVDATGEPFAEGNTVFTLSDGMKVGVFGLDTPTTATASTPKNTAGLSFASGSELYAAAQAQIDELDEQGCSVIVCVAHLGEENVTEEINAKNVVENTRGISVVIDGHDHQVESQTVKDLDGNDVLIVETGSYLKNIGILSYEDGRFSEDLAEIGTYKGSDPEVAELVAGFSEEMEKALSKKVAFTDWDLSGDGYDRETNLGDLVADAIYWQASQAFADAPDAAILNGGGIRKTIEAGVILQSDIRDVLPFNNQICSVEVTGAELLEALEAATQLSPKESGSFPQVSQIKYTLDTTVPYQNGALYPDSSYFAPAAPGSRVTITEVGGEPFDPEATYTIATIEFVAAGGDTYYCFAKAGAKTMAYAGYLDSEALANYLKTELNGTIPEIYEKPQGRITLIGG